VARFEDSETLTQRRRPQGDDASPSGGAPSV